MTERGAESKPKRRRKNVFIGSNPITGRPYFESRPVNTSEEVTHPTQPPEKKGESKGDEQRVEAWQTAVSPEDATEERMEEVIKNQQGQPPKTEEEK